jgi:transcriptional regulator of aromatic amino acid metabolism
MKRVCAWCQKPLNDEPEDENPISHGICERCLEFVETDRTAIRTFLNTLDAPVLAVDGDGRAISANRLALAALNKDHSEIADRLGGEVIECQYSYMPEKCGKTIHCTGCQIRGSVTHTLRTGEPLVRVKAYQHIMTLTGVKTFNYLISTEKLGDTTVLLRIDETRETGE